MKIEETIDKIEEWVKSNNLDLIYGIAETKSSTTVLFDTNQTEIEKYLALGKKNGAEIIIQHVSTFQSDEILEELGIDENESNSKVKAQIKKLKTYQDKAEFLSVAWLKDSVVYEYAGTADWVDEIDEIKNKIIEVNEETGTLSYRAMKQKEMPQKKVKEIGKLVAKHDDYFTNQYNQDRLGSILMEALETLEIKETALGFFDRNRIMSEARTYFDRYLLKEKEKELIEKIAELKGEGLPKVAIRSKLGITEGMLNKYYY